MKTSKPLKLVLLGGAALSLAACGGHHGGNSATTTVTPPASLQSQFGVNFNTDFMASANSEPVVPAAGDIIALTLTAEPVALH